MIASRSRSAAVNWLERAGDRGCEAAERAGEFLGAGVGARIPVQKETRTDRILPLPLPLPLNLPPPVAEEDKDEDEEEEEERGRRVGG